MLWVVESMQQRSAIGGFTSPQKDQFQLPIIDQCVEMGKDTASIPHTPPFV